MKKKEKGEIRSKTRQELVLELTKREIELLRLKAEVKTGKVKNTSLPKIKTDEIAVIKTILKEKMFMEEAKK